MNICTFEFENAEVNIHYTSKPDKKHIENACKHFINSIGSAFEKTLGAKQEGETICDKTLPAPTKRIG